MPLLIKELLLKEVPDNGDDDDDDDEKYMGESSFTWDDTKP